MNNIYIVFDLDETIGHFTQIGILWESLQYIFNDDLNQKLFNYLLDEYSCFLRPSILTIFKYLKNMKSKNKNIKICIYTNNQGPKSWCKMIANYIEFKLKTNKKKPFFDQIIYAYKIDNIIVEPKRTSHEKIYTDLIRCLKAYKNDKICFIDDQFHKKMIHDNVTYINIKPYIYNYSNDELIEHFYTSGTYKLFCKELDYQENWNIDNSRLVKSINSYSFNIKNISDDEIKVDKILTKKLIQHITRFLKQNYFTSKKTTKKNNMFKKKTQKNNHVMLFEPAEEAESIKS
jgi:hypothetical protein